MTQAVENDDDLDILRSKLRACLRMDTLTNPSDYDRDDITNLNMMGGHYVKTIWTLQTSHIQNILARYAPSRDRRANAARHLSQHAAQGFRTRITRKRARIIGLTLILSPSAERRLHDVFGMTAREWQESSHKQLTREVRILLTQVDEDSLTAWRRTVHRLQNNEGS